ncbi:TetR/AcrR family transcriptional regulator [Gryllotalpicola koreensis]|uniref:TetR/AcrR family transcriptional regulator C-terminal domain-containing protein n=1 Tax=Gryllotalpicola koreensis TaxID=993086 RepID=A0ABP8A3D4_9MICO
MAVRDEPVSRRERPAKPALSRRSILDAALTLIRERGVESVSLRHVAERVQTGPASLYAYFASRDVLLEHVLDDVYGTVELVDAGAGDRGWRDALAGTIVNTIDALGRYPGLGAVALGMIPTLPGALRLADHELGLMSLGGIPEAQAGLAIDLIAQFVAATATERTVRGAPLGAPERDAIRDAFRSADPERFPHLVRSVDALTRPTEQERRDFAIQVIIAGIAGAGGSVWAAGPASARA